jgi:hypothetical protein
MSQKKIDMTIPVSPLPGEGTMIGTAHFQMRFSVQHLLAAAEFSRQVGKVEVANAGQDYGSFCDEILWHATACVFCCVASLEAYANEVFIDREQNFPNLRKELADKFWEFSEMERILEKFDLALMLRDKPTFDRGKQPYQDANALVSLRNALTHFKPESIGEKNSPHTQVSNLLKNRFQPSPFKTGDATIFPRDWASHGCTSWAVRTCVKFVEQFESTAGLTSKFGPYKSRLKA